MEIGAIISLLSLGINTLLSLLNSSGVTKTDYSKLAATLEGALAPIIALIPGWLKGGQPASATTDILAAYATLIGVLNALKSQPGLPADLLARIQEYILAAQDGTTAYLAAAKGFDPSLFTPVSPMPHAA